MVDFLYDDLYNFINSDNSCYEEDQYIYDGVKRVKCLLKISSPSHIRNLLRSNYVNIVVTFAIRRKKMCYFIANLGGTAEIKRFRPYLI